MQIAGWDIGCPMGGNLGKCDKREVTSGQTRKGGETGLLGRTSGTSVATLSGQRKTPQG